MLIVIVMLWLLEVVIVEFIVMLAMLVIVELDTETELGIELVASGMVVVELPAAEGEDSTGADGEAESPAPTLVPQYVDAKAARAAEEGLC